MKRLIKIDPENPDFKRIEEVAFYLKEGKIMVYPTDTFYGLGGDPYNREVVERIYRIKERERGKPIPVIVSDVKMAEEMAGSIPDIFYKLVEKFWPGALTVVLKASSKAPRSIMANSNSIGVRIPNSKFCVELIRTCEFPITSTSANVSGEHEISSPERAIKDLLNKVELLIDGGNTKGFRPSTVIDLSSGRLTILREGAIRKDDILSVCKNRA
ncbi:MAG: L-threonylcarbamoyladenylate synthase [Acidobacteriota bacterium]